MKIALFTGAGASKAIGYPLTGEFLPRVRAGLKDESLFYELLPAETKTEERKQRKKEKRDRLELEKYLNKLLLGFRDVPDQQLPLITDLFSLVDYALLSGENLPIGGQKSLLRCRELLKQAIADVLLGDFETPWDLDDAEEVSQKDVLKRLSNWIKKERKNLALITTNYDIGIEYELYYSLRQSEVYRSIDLGFDWRHIGEGDVRTRPRNPGLRVYKLHGSLDLLRCPICGYVYFNPWGAIARYAFVDELDDNNVCHCSGDVKLDLHIVSPSLVRDVRDASLQSVWRASFEWLREADHWIIVGYSLPPEDLAVRSLLLRAYNAADPKPKITVVQKKSKNDIEEPRYRVLFPKCQYKTYGLEGFLKGNRL